MSVERVEAAGFTELGEGPHWDAITQSLYYVDIFGNSIHKYTPSTNSHDVAKIGRAVSLIVPVHNLPNTFVVSVGREIATLSWHGGCECLTKLQIIAEVDKERGVNTNRINDGKCDPSGRLWFGTMGEEPINGKIALDRGSLFHLHADKTVQKHLSHVDCSNGLAWNADRTKFYYIDSMKLTIDEFDYDDSSASISNRKPIFSFEENSIKGMPDGMTMDTDGNLWVACFNGSQVIKIDPRKPDTLLQTVKIPALQVTSVAFGGPTLEDLYVTTAKFTVEDNILESSDHGALYKITGLGVKGLPGVAVKF